MSDRSIMHAPEAGGPGNWLDGYMANNQLQRFEPQSRLINVSAIRGILFRQRWLIAGVILASLIGGLVMTLLATPMYEARSSVRIEPYGNFVVEGQNIDQGISANQVYDLLATQVGIITSRSLARQVAEEIDLGSRTDFLGADIDESRPANLSDEAWLAQKQDMAAAILQSSVEAEVPQNNWIIEIAYRSPSPTIAAEVANAYAAAFAASETRESIESNEYAQGYLRDQITTTRQRLEEAELAANNYARSRGIILQSVPSEDGEAGTTTLTSSNLASINSRVSAARAARIEAEQRWRAVQGVPTSQLPAVQSSPLLQGLISDRTAKQARLAELRQRYLEGHPQVRELIAQIATLDAQIERSGNDIRAAARTEFLVAQSQEQALTSELNAVTGDTLEEQDSQVQYSVLEREAQALRDQLQALLNRFNEVSTAATVQSGTINLLDSAVVPGAPYAPSLLSNLAIALVLGIALAGVLAALRETIDDKIRSPEDLEERVGLKLLGHTPFVDERDIEYEGANRFGSLMEAYASIRSTLEFSVPRDRNVIQLTSTQESEGKSTTAIVLAELSASLGRKTLLIDIDLRRPSVASLLGLGRPKLGLVEVLLGMTDLQSAVIKGAHENLDILPVCQAPSNPIELLASPQLREFFAKHRHEYSLIICDSCPVLGLADAPMLARIVDGTIFVLEANRISYGQARSSIQRVRASGGTVIGGILTKYRALQAGQSYDYQYKYYSYEKDSGSTTARA